MRKKATNIVLSTLLIGMMTPQIAFANTKAPIELKNYENTEGQEKDIVITWCDWFRDKDTKIHSFNSLGIEDREMLVKAKANKYGYTIKLKNKTYYLVGIDKSREIRTTYKVPAKTIREFDNMQSRPTDFNMVKPKYKDSEILDQAVENFKRINQNTNDFEAQIKNAVKTVYDMKLEYGGDSSKQGDLSDGKTKCDGFTWIFSELLSNTNIKYRYVLTAPRTGVFRTPIGEKEETNYHIYNEVYNPNIKAWVRLENTILDYTSIDSMLGKNIDEKINNFYQGNFTRPSEILDINYVWLLDKKDQDKSQKISYVSETYQGKKVVDPTSYEVTEITYIDSTIVSKAFLDKSNY